MMICMGLLHCVDQKKPEKKAIAFFELLQDGGAEKQAYISSQDKDWKPVTIKLFSVATICVNEATGGKYYNEADCKEFKNAFSAVAGFDEEDPSLLEDIFGTQSKQKYETFIEIVQTKAKWIFNAIEVRKRVFDVSQVQVKHIK